MTDHEQNRPGPPAQQQRHGRFGGYIGSRRLGRAIDRFASGAIALVVDVLVLLMAIVLVWSVVALGVVIFDTVQQSNAEQIKDLVIGVLTIFIVIEIFDLFREYLRSAHIRVTNLAEVSLAVVLRELWLLLLDGSENWQLYSALAAVVVALAVFWWLATRQQDLDRRSGATSAAPAGDDTPADELPVTIASGDASPAHERPGPTPADPN